MSTDSEEVKVRRDEMLAYGFSLWDAFLAARLNPFRLLFRDCRRKVDRRAATRYSAKARDDVTRLAKTVGDARVSVSQDMDELSRLVDMENEFETLATAIEKGESVDESEAQRLVALLDKDTDLLALISGSKGIGALPAWRIITQPGIARQICSAIRVSIQVRSKGVYLKKIGSEKMAETYSTLRKALVTGEMLVEVEGILSADEKAVLSVNRLADVITRLSLQAREWDQEAIGVKMPVPSIDQSEYVKVMGELGIRAPLALPAAESMSIPVSMPVEVGCEEEFNS